MSGPEIPADTILTVAIEEQEIPLLLSQLVQDNTVLDHEAVVQHQDVPVIEHDPNLDLLLRSSPNFTAVSDPNAPINEQHVLSPSIIRSINQENSELVSFGDFFLFL